MSFGHITLMHLQAHLVWLKWFPVFLLLNSILCCWQYKWWVFWATHNHNGRWTHNEREYYCKLIKESFSFFFNESRGHDSAITPTHTTLTEYLSRHWQLVDPKAWWQEGGWDFNTNFATCGSSLCHLAAIIFNVFFKHYDEMSREPVTEVRHAWVNSVSLNPNNKV